jgi:uncharacterized protein YbjT (DUF2867 family)
MSPSILIVGATGNTGGGVVDTVLALAPNTPFANHTVIALTRNAQGSSAKALASKYGGRLQIIEKDWTMIDAAWLKEHEVERLFIASHNGVSQFVDESLFLTAALEAKCVKYVCRISTTHANVGPDTPVWYARTHWAIETLLETPQFGSLHWSSLQPNGFISLVGQALESWLKTYRESGKKETLRLIIDGNNPVALIDPYEVGVVAGHLLVSADTAKHNKQKYILVGPTNVSGKEAVSLLEKYAGTSVDDVVYRDTSFVDYLISTGDYPESIAASLRLAPRSGYDGGDSVERSPTSPEVLELYKLKNGALETYDKALAAIAK